MSQLELVAGTATGSDTDPGLTARALAGDTAAFEELYRRHAPAAWRVAQAVAGNPDDAADAVSDAFTKVFAAIQDGRFDPEAPFRPYLLAAARNAAIDVLRRRGREPDVIDLTERSAGDRSADSLVDELDRGFVASAFRSLPERWRAVLWLTEVEGIPPREAATVLGLSPNGTAQLAVRARAALRARFLQAHLRHAEDDACRTTVELLGAYVAGGLAPRDVARVDQHLAGCDRCRQRLHDLEDVGSGMALAVLPLPVALAAAARWRAGALPASVEQPGGIARWFGGARPATRAVGTWAAGVFTAGVLSLFGADFDDGAGEPAAPSRPAASQPVTGGDVEVLSETGERTAASPVPLPRARREPPVSDEPTGAPGPAPPAATPPAATPPAAGPPGGAPEPAPGLAEVQAGAALEGDGVAVSVGVGGGCTGGTAGPATAGCATSPPEGTGVEVTLGGSAVPVVEVELP